MPEVFVIPQPGSDNPTVTMKQARTALFNAGKLDLVDAAIAALPEPQKTLAAIQWQYSATVERRHGLVEMLGDAIGLTSDDIDALFEAAKNL